MKFGKNRKSFSILSKSSKFTKKFGRFAREWVNIVKCLSLMIIFRKSRNMLNSFSFYRNNKTSNEIPIYNYVCKDNPLTWDDLKDMSAKYGIDTPTARAVWYYSFRNNKYKIVHLFFIYFLHLLPALLVDAATVCIGKEPK